MNTRREKILVVEGEAPSREALISILNEAGYQVMAAEPDAAFDRAVSDDVDLLILDADLSELDCCDVLTRLKGNAATQDIRAILFAAGGAAERTRALDLGADDVLSRPGEAGELLARVRGQLRSRRELRDLRDKTRIAEEGQKIAHTAFQALAVTEKMTRDAFSLDRMLRIGVGAAGLIALVMAIIFFGFSRRAEKETSRAYAALAQLQSGITTQEDLLARTGRLRQEIEAAAASNLEQQRKSLEQQSADLQARMASANEGEVATLRRQLDDTGARIRRLESESRVAQGIIRNYAPSVCLIHVVVAFRDKATGRRLRYAGINPQGQPLQDSAGNPIFELDGRGPDVRGDFFGTGFLVAGSGRILTNRHVVEPWWKDDDLGTLSQQGLEPILSSIAAYFPDEPRTFRVEIQKISPDADLAVVAGDLSGLKRSAPALDSGTGAAVTGRPVILIGYPTGLDAILARAGEETVRDVVMASGGDRREIMQALAQRKLIRPISTQGHIGDVLRDRIVYDAQTTSGGSGGPLFNAQGKVIGVNFAVVRGFGGSNFGIPIRYAEPLLR